MASLRSQYLGEDVELVAQYEDGDGNAVDPDDQDTDGTPDAFITIRKQDADTPLVDSVAMTHDGVGEFSYVWDTAVDNDGTGTYVVESEADLSGLTDIDRVTIKLR